MLVGWDQEFDGIRGTGACRLGHILLFPLFPLLHLLILLLLFLLCRRLASLGHRHMQMGEDQFVRGHEEEALHGLP